MHQSIKSWIFLRKLFPTYKEDVTCVDELKLVAFSSHCGNKANESKQLHKNQRQSLRTQQKANRCFLAGRAFLTTEERRDEDIKKKRGHLRHWPEYTWPLQPDRHKTLMGEQAVFIFPDQVSGQHLRAGLTLDLCKWQSFIWASQRRSSANSYVCNTHHPQS